MEERKLTCDVMYFLGIGGIGMSALARYFHRKGVHVMGYDRTSTALTTELELEGISVQYEDSVMSLPQLLHSTPKEKVLIVRTPAVPKDSSQLQYFLQHEFRIWKRSELLGFITELDETIAIGGTHGKTTTSTLVAHILHSTIGCNAFLGGISSNFNSNVLLSDTSRTVVEADEFDRSFLTLFPKISALTSMDPDHLDIYGNEESIREGFLLFLKQTHANGSIVVKKELNIHEDLKSARSGVFTYSILSEADYVATNIRIEDGAYVFNFNSPFGQLSHVRLGLPGRHNVENAVLAMACSLLAGVSIGDLPQVLESFKGVARRFDVRYKGESGVYIDDYAHHPTELAACIRSVRELFPGKKIVGVFQPHLFSRTRDFVDGFAESLALIDVPVLLPIYPARELPIEGIDSQWLFDKIQKTDKYIVEKDAIFTLLNKLQFDVLLTLGAGDIDTLVSPLEVFMKGRIK
jgi:UDP-N-acetylmuramate--alanine ligase